MKRKLNIWIQGGFYFIAGINHFINPGFYYDLIPKYLGDPVIINIIAGAMELLLGIGLLVPMTRKLSAYGIIGMLTIFILSHVYFVQIGSCIEGGLCVPEWMGWFRLVLIHPLLMYWAWSARK